MASYDAVNQQAGGRNAMISPYTREKIENWVSDFVASDRLREAPPSTHEHAAAVLMEFMTRACGPREARAEAPGTGRGFEIGPEEIEETDVKHALLDAAHGLVRLNLPDAARKDVPVLCAAFLAQLEEEGRLGGGRVLGAYANALREPFAEAAGGKRKPFVRPGSKIGRNDPCPCGSGKKYKSCCLRG